MKAEVYDEKRATLTNMLLNGKLSHVHMGDEVFEYATEGMSQEEKFGFWCQIMEARVERLKTRVRLLDEAM